MKTKSDFAGFLDSYRASNIAIAEPFIDATLKGISESAANALSHLDKLDKECAASLKSTLEKIIKIANSTEENREQQLNSIGIALRTLLELHLTEIKRLQKLENAVRSVVLQFLAIAQKMDSIVVKNIAISLGEKMS